MKKFKVKPIGDSNTEYDDYIYYFTSDLLCYERKYSYCSSECKNYIILPKLLSGSLKIVKELTTKDINLTPEEQTVINYCKLCGYKYLAKDKDGAIWAHKEKPVKRSLMWLNIDDNDVIEIKYNLSFLSWGDEEPWGIE
jgi:hypothetical protein